METRRRCEQAVRNETDELTRQIKQGMLPTEADISAKIDLLKQIMYECLEQITYADKESFISQKCAEMTSMAHRHLL